MSIVCTICQDLVTERPQTLEPTEELIILAVSCGHIFHRSCIREWFHKGQNDENGQCPCCKTNVSISQGLRLFPSGDEEGQAMAERVSKAKNTLAELKDSRNEMEQLKMILEETACELENEKLVHEILRFEHGATLSEIDELKRQSEDQAKLIEAQESNWKGIVDGVTKEKDDALGMVQVMERQYTRERLEQENQEENYLRQISDLNKKLEIESATKDSLKIRMMEQAHLNEIKHYENLLKRGPMVDVECQTDGRDAALLQGRLVSYKSCLLHMQSEVRLLESEYDKLKLLQPVDESFGSLMNDALNQSVDVILLDSALSDDKDFDDQVDNSNEDNMVISTEEEDSGGSGDAKVWGVGVDQRRSSADNKSLSSHDNEEFCDAPLWATEDK